METKVLNYRIIIEPDRETGTDKPGFTAYCPTLGLADDGDTIEEALKNIKAMVKFHLKCLSEEGADIPSPDNDQGLITSLKIEVSSKHLSFA